MMKKPLKIITAFGTFVGTFLIYHIIGSNFFPVNEDNVLQAPNWYPILGMAIAAVVSFLSVKGGKVSKEVINIVKNDIAENRRYYREIKGETFISPQFDKNKYWVKGDLDLLETDLVEIGHVEVCCEKCARYRERIFSLTGADKRFPKIPEDFDSACCRISLSPFVWGVSEPSFHCANVIRHSNRPFTDERTDEEKERYENWRRARMRTDKDAHAPVRVKNRDPMEIIRIMERRFEEQYQFAYKHLFNLHDCQKMYEKTVKEFDSIELPLMAQMRFEQLCAEYKEKFNITNPFVVVDAMDGHAFEYWCAELLRKNGFVDVEVTPGSGDQGVDVIAVKEGVRYAIQCKCYSSDLSNKPVQEVHTGKSIYKCQVGVVMTNRHFTLGAKEAADATGVLLWDRDKLEELITNAKAGE